MTAASKCTHWWPYLRSARLWKVSYGLYFLIHVSFRLLAFRRMWYCEWRTGPEILVDLDHYKKDLFPFSFLTFLLLVSFSRCTCMWNYQHHHHHHTCLNSLPRILRAPGFRTRNTSTSFHQQNRPYPRPSGLTTSWDSSLTLNAHELYKFYFTNTEPMIPWPE